MTAYPITPIDTRAIADEASEAIRALNHATHPADGFPGLEYPADAYHLLGALQQLTCRLPQLAGQISAFLQHQLQHDVISIDGGQFLGDPLGAVGTASHELEGHVTECACRLEHALDAAQQAIAFASHTGTDPDLC